MSKNKFTPIEIYQVKDKSDNYTIEKDLNMFSLPCRLGLFGSSGSGKTSLLTNLMCIHYDKEFKGEDIFIVSSCVNQDLKLKAIIKYKEIPDSNIFNGFNEGRMMALYEHLMEEYEKAHEDEKQKPKHTIVIFDDIGATGELRCKHDGMLSMLVNVGRKALVSCIFLAQKFTQISPIIRTQLNGAAFFIHSKYEVEQIMKQMCFMDTKTFAKQFHYATHLKDPDGNEITFNKKKPSQGMFIFNKTNPTGKYYINNFKYLIEYDHVDKKNHTVIDDTIHKEQKLE